MIAQVAALERQDRRHDLGRTRRRQLFVRILRPDDASALCVHDDRRLLAVIRGASEVSADAICDVNIAAATTTHVPKRPVCIDGPPGHFANVWRWEYFTARSVLDKE